MRPIWFAITAEPEHAARATTATLDAARGHAHGVQARLGADAPPAQRAAWELLSAAWTGPVGRAVGRLRGALGGEPHGAVRFPAADDDAWAALLALVPWVTVDLVGDGQAEVARTAEGGLTCVARLTAEQGAALRELLTGGEAEGTGVTVEQLGANRTWYELGGTS